MKTNYLFKARWLQGAASANESKKMQVNPRIVSIRFACTLLLFLTLGIGNAWGGITNNNNGTYTETSGTGTFSSNTITWSFAGGNITVVQTATGGTNPNSSYTANARVYQYNTLTISANNGFKIAKVEIVVNGTNYGAGVQAGTSVSSNTVGNTSNVTTTLTTSSGGTHTFTPATDGAKTLFYIRNRNTGSTNKQLQWNSGNLKVTYSYTAPTAVAKGATITASSFDLSITDALNTNKYDVYFSESTGAPANNIAAGNYQTFTSKTPTVSSGVAGGKTYYVWARSVKTISSTTWNSAWVALTGSTLSTPSAGCSNYSFHFGATANADGKNITDQTVECFTQVGSSTEWQLADFTIPTTTQYYFVGYAGYFYDSNIGPSGASNSGSERNQFKYLPVANLQGSSCSGSGDSYKHAAAGAHGKIRIYSDNSGKNIYAGFIPSGYQMRYGTDGGSDWANIQLTQVSSSAVWKSAVMDLTAAMVAKRYYVNVWTSGSYAADDEGVAINNWTNGGSAISSMKRKTNNGDYWADGVSDGMRGFFRTWTDNCADNGYMHFVPTHRIIYHANYPVGDSPADTYSVDVSVEETNSSISLASAPSAPDGYTFLGWFTAASGGTQRTGTQTISAGASADVELYAHWEHVPVITVSETSCAFGDRKVNGGPYTMKFNVSGSYLKGNISLAVSGTNAAMFDVSPKTLTPTTGTVSSTEITVSYSPTGAGAHTAQIDITSSSATSKTVDLSGTGKWEVIWSVDGVETPSLVADSEKPTLPSPNPSSCDATSTTFIGWATAAWTGKLASLAGKTVHTAASTMDAVTANGTKYYAVFAKSSGGSSGSFDITASDITATSNSADETTFTKLSTDDFGYVHTIKNGNNDPTGWNQYQLIQIRGNNKGTGELYNKEAISGLTKLRIVEHSNASALTVYYGTTSKSTSSSISSPFASATSTQSVTYKINSSETTTTADLNYYDINIPSGNEYFCLSNSSSGGTTWLHTITVYYSTVTYSDYLTTCCDNNVTLADGSPTNGSITFDPEGPIETCSAAKEVIMTIIPDAGYYLSNYSSSGVSTSNSPSIATSGSASGTEQSISLTFAQNTTTGTYTAAATFTAKTASGWTWKYNDEDVPNPLHLYVNEVKQLDVTWEPEDLLDDQKGYSVTKESSIAENSKQPSYYRFHGSAGVTSLINTSISFSLAGLTTKVVNVTVEPLPVVQFVDIIHNESFDNVVATASAGVVTFEKQTPTHDDFDGSTANSCEENHLHLVGWIYSEWSGAANYMNGTSAAPNKAALTAAKVGTADGFAEDNTPCFFEPGATINTETWKGKTFYAVWGKLTE